MHGDADGAADDDYGAGGYPAAVDGFVDYHDHSGCDDGSAADGSGPSVAHYGALGGSAFDEVPDAAADSAVVDDSYYSSSSSLPQKSAAAKVVEAV